MEREEMLAGLKERVDRADEAIVTAKDELKTAERAGIDVTEQKARLTEVETKVKRLKTAYKL